MQLNVKKLQKQLSIIELWVKNGYKGTVEAVTGFGKSYIGVLCIQRMNARNPNQTAIIIVPTLYLQEQWMTSVREYKLLNTQVLVINSAVKINRACDLLILDEIHRYAADVFGLIFTSMTTKAILGLTATIKRSDERHLMLLEHAPTICTISFKEALKEGYISPFLVYNLGLIMSKEEQLEYETISKSYIYYFSFFDQNFTIAQACLKDEFTILQVARRWKLDPGEIKVKAINFMRTMQKRRKFLYNAKVKMRTAVEILSRFPVRTICFAETTDFADELANGINKRGEEIAVSYHSKIGIKKRRIAMEDFKDKTTKVRIISTARALDEGFDIEGIELGLIASGSATERQQIQRLGRSIRFVEGKIALIINLYLKGTQDEQWAKKRQANTPNVHWITSIDEISYETPEGKHNFEATQLPRFSLAAQGRVF